MWVGRDGQRGEEVFVLRQFLLTSPEDRNVAVRWSPASWLLWVLLQGAFSSQGFKVKVQSQEP